jgi:hypothetical protein
MVTAAPIRPKLLKGALIGFTDRFLVPIPNIILFQYNPETLTRNLTPWEPPAEEEGQSPITPGTAQPFDPAESFTLSLFLDAADDLEAPEQNPVTTLTGVADRIAALEMLMYPQRTEGTPLNVPEVDTLAGGEGGSEEPIERLGIQVVLFIYGPGRALPVRISKFTVEEQLFSTTLYPIRAKVNLELAVLQPSAFPENEQKAGRDFALKAYDWTRKQTQVLAVANLANTAESLLGLLPF